MRLVEKYGSLNGRHTAKFVNNCTPSEYWIVNRWAKWFKQKKVPYEIWEERGKEGPVRYLIKEWRTYTPEELGWKKLVDA